jgi:hypothetical protein
MGILLYGWLYVSGLEWEALLLGVNSRVNP